MKQDDIDLLLVGGLATVILGSALAKMHMVSGVGAVRKKRRIYHEIADVQKAGIDISTSWLYLDSTDRDKVTDIGRKYGYKQPSSSTKAYGEAYYSTLQRAYKQISGIGETDLPKKKSVIRNDRGDIIMEYFDYGTPEQQMADAMAWWTDHARYAVGDDEAFGYDMTVYDIANGVKFLWSGKRDKNGYQVKRGILEEIFGGTGKFDLTTRANAERKARVSYLGSEKSGALSPEAEAHNVYQYAHSYFDFDYSAVKNGVLEAFRMIQSPKQAKQIIWEEYIKAHTLPDPDDMMAQYQEQEYLDINHDMPF